MPTYDGNNIRITGAFGYSNLPDSEMQARNGWAAEQRLVGALMASDSAAHVMTEAMRAMVEAWFLLAQISPQGSLLERSEQAVEVLEQGIADLKFALNEGPEPD